VRKINNSKPSNKPKLEEIKKERKELVKRTKDNTLNISRAREDVGKECSICGEEIKKNQAFRVLPKDKNCQELRLYHLRTCGPGSDNWNAFKTNGKKPPEKSVLKGQLSLRWKGKQVSVILGKEVQT
jgi:hypothetical protein